MEHEIFNVLLVEDNPGDKRIIQEMLQDARSMQYKIVNARRLDEAVKLIGKNNIDVAILDLNLPDSSGVDTFLTFQKHNIDLPVVLLTRPDDNTIGNEAIRKGAQDCLIKDRIDSHVLMRALLYAIDRKRSEKKLRRTSALLLEELKELETTHKQIIEKERLNALGQMAGWISNDFNNLLSPIVGYSDMILGDPEILNNKSQVLNDLKTINTAGKDAKKVINRMREFYRRHHVKEFSNKVDCNALIKQVVQMSEPKWKEQAQANGINIKLVTRLQKIPCFTGDEAGFREVFTNLIFNAVDAITHDGIICISTTQDKEELILEVSDTGKGMTEEEKAHCFEPFYTTKGKAGTGLGLSTVYGIIKRHNGRVEINSQHGKGTTFTIHLPLRPVPKKEKEKGKENNTACRSLSILVVDDNVTVCNLISRFLSTLGHTTEIAMDGKQGLQKFLKGAYDLVIVDRVMPGMEGDKLADAIKDVNSKKPVIMISGFGDFMESANEKPKSVDFLIGKPIVFDELKDILVEAMQI
jgi:signal transduction histidine kinase